MESIDQIRLDNKFIESLPIGYALHKIVLDDTGKPIDYIYLEINSEFENLTGMKRENIIGKGIKEILPNIVNDEFDWIGFYGDIALNNTVREFEENAETLHKHYRVKAYSPKKYYFVTYFTDISDTISIIKTSRKFLEHDSEISNQEICDIMRQISKAKFVTYQQYDKTNEFYRTLAVSGNKADLRIVSKELDLERADSKWYKFSESNNKVDTNQITQICDYKKFPENSFVRNFMSTVKEQFETGECFIVKLTESSNVLGNFVIVMDINTIAGNSSSIEIYAKQVGLFLKKSHVEKLLTENEERLKLAMEAGENGFWDWNLETDEMYFSPQYSIMLGYEAHELTLFNNTWIDLIHPSDKEKNLPYIMESIYNGKPFSHEIRMKCKNGVWKWIASRGKSFDLNDDGKPTRAIGVHVDITERKLAEEKTKYFNKLFQTVLSRAPFGIQVLSGDSKLRNILIENPEAKRLMGEKFRKKQNMLIDTELELSVQFFTPDGKIAVDKHSTPSYKAWNGKTISNEEYLIKHPDGEKYYVLASATPIEDSESNIMAVLTTFQDITFRKIAEKNIIESERKYRSIIENMTDIYFRTDIDGNLILLSTSAAELSEYDSLDNILGQNVDIFFENTEDRKIIREKIDQNSGRLKNFEVNLLTRNKKVITVILSASYYFDDNDNIAGIEGVFSDISDRKAYELTLESQKNRLATIISCTKAGTWEWNVQTGETIFDFHWANMLGYSLEELEPISLKTWEKLTHPEDLKKCELELEKHFRGETEIYVQELRMKHKDGSWYWILDRGQVIEWDDEHNPIWMFGTHTDINMTKSLQAQLIHAQKMETIGTLAGGVAHEFNNLLTPILGYAEMTLMDLDESSPIRDELTQIKDSAERAREIIKQLLLFGRKIGEDKSIIELKSELEKSVKLTKSTVSNSINVSLILPKNNIYIEGDSVQINQVIMNLITNAIHAIDIKGTIEVRLSNSHFEEEMFINKFPIYPGTYAHITVKDDGHGIPDEVREKIFEPFFTTKDIGKGTGLGLSVVHGIIDNHNGAISVESEIDQGTTFNIYLPVTELTETKNNPITTPEKTSNDTKIHKAQYTVLVIDDSKDNVTFLATLIKKIGYSALSTTSTRDAIEIFNEHVDDISLILTDVTMPYISGIEFAEIIRKTNSDIPIVLMTGHSSKITDQLLEELKISEVILKPILYEPLQNILDNFILE